MSLLINIDNGGTLTDIRVMDGDRSWHTKTITTPYDLSKCFFEGLKKVAGLIYGRDDLDILLRNTDHIRYSTTQGTNALVMKKGPRLGLVVDQGFDLEALAGSARQREMFHALVGPRVEVVDNGLAGVRYQQAMVDAVNLLSSRGANRIVVAFSDDHRAMEARFRRMSLSMFPRHLLGAVPILYAGSLSGDRNTVRRCWTALNNAFLHPAMERFLYNAENRMREYRVRNPLLIYRNDGYAGRVAKTIALKTYSSGPRAGMESARAYANHYGFGRLLTMDVGGTTTDIGLVENNTVKVLPHGEVEGVECSFPLSDIVSIGVGGGSILRVEEDGMRVGPDSVGGAPGPACFGMGGREATITDALLVMGLLDPRTYFGGEMNLDRDRAVAVIENNIAGKLGISVESAVHRMLDLWAQKIAEGLKQYTDISADTVLTAFGGGGPMAVLNVAAAAGIDKVLIPRLAAVFSAHGIGFSDIAHSAENRLPSNTGDALREELEALAARVHRDMFSEGFSPEQCATSAWLTVNGDRVDIDIADPVLPENVEAGDEVAVSVRSVRAVAHATLPEENDSEECEPRITGVREIATTDGRTTQFYVIDVDEQPAGAVGQGPVVIEEKFWTCKVDGGWSYRFTANGDVLLTRNH